MKLYNVLLLICFLSLSIRGQHKVVAYSEDVYPFVSDTCFWKAYYLYNTLGWNDIPIEAYQNTLIFITYQQTESITEIQIEASMDSEDLIDKHLLAYFFDAENQNLVFVSLPKYPKADTIWQKKMLHMSMKLLKDSVNYDWQRGKLLKYIPRNYVLFDPTRITYRFKEGELRNKVW